jgi:hypothetical protein
VRGCGIKISGLSYLLKEKERKKEYGEARLVE